MHLPLPFRVYVDFNIQHTSLWMDIRCILLSLIPKYTALELPSLMLCIFAMGYTSPTGKPINDQEMSWYHFICRLVMDDNGPSTGTMLIIWVINGWCVFTARERRNPSKLDADEAVLRWCQISRILSVFVITGIMDRNLAQTFQVTEYNLWGIEVLS